MSTLSLDGTLAKRPWDSDEDESPVSRPRSPLYDAAASSPPEGGPTAPKRARLSSPGPSTSTQLDGSSDEEDACSEACCGGTKAASGEEGRDTSAGGSSSVDKPENETDHQPPSTEDETSEQRIERLVDDLESELCCPICSAVLYKVRRPVHSHLTRARLSWAARSNPSVGPRLTQEPSSLLSSARDDPTRMRSCVLRSVPVWLPQGASRPSGWRCYSADSI